MKTQLYRLVKENRPLFWSVGETNLKDLSELSVVEAILNYGNLDSVRKLFELLGTEKVADIFYWRQSQKRSNYHPQVAHFFDAYFKRHVQKYSKS